MADLKYQVGVDTREGQRNLNNLDAATKRTVTGFAQLKTALVGLATFAGLRSLLQLSNQLVDLSNATGVSVQAIAGLGEALARNSGNFTDVTRVIQVFNESLSRAVTEGGETLDALNRLGISLQDLRTLDETDILLKTIEGFGRLESETERTELRMRLFRNSLRGIDIVGLANDVRLASLDMQRYAEVAQRAGEVNQRATNTFRLLGQEILIALEPIISLVEAWTQSEEATRNFIQTAVKIGTVIAVFAAVVVAAKLVAATFAVIGASLAAVVGIFGKVGAGAKVTGAALAGAGLASTRFGRAIEWIRNIVAAVLPWLQGLASGLVSVVAAMLSSLTAIRLFGDQVEDTGSSLLESSGDIDQAAQNLLDGARSLEQAGEVIRDVDQAFVRLTESTNQTTRAFATQVAQFERQFKLQTGMLTLSDTQQESVRALQSIESQYLNTVRPLQEQLITLRERGTEAAEEEAKIVEATIRQITAAYEQQQRRVANLVADRQNILDLLEQQRVEEQRLAEVAAKTLEATRQSQIIYDQMADSTRDLRQSLEQLNMSEFEKSVAKVNNDMDNLIETTRRQYKELETEENRSNVQLMMQDAIDSIEQARAAQIQLLKDSNEQQRSFVNGWRNAFREYRDAATNSARAAQRIFSTVTRNMEDSIVNFAKTGKFEFRSFVAVVLEELLRIQIQRTFAGLMSPTGGGSGSLFAGFFATGGQIPPGRFGVVGERGPELVEGPANVTPLGSATVTYNINAVDAQSFRQMVARDPEFLYAVTEQGRRRAPGTRR